MSKPTIKLYPPTQGEQVLVYTDCEVEDSLIPDLSFRGTKDGERVRVLTSLAYTITLPTEITEPIAPWRG